MSKEAIDKIREAEEEAAAIRRGVGVKVTALLDAEEKKGLKLKENAEIEAKAERNSKISAAESKAAAILENGRVKALSEAEEIRSAAEKKLPDAAEIILKGVDAMCR